MTEEEKLEAEIRELRRQIRDFTQVRTDIINRARRRMKERRWT